MGYFYQHLNQLERDQISILDAGELSCAEIWEYLNRSASSISRELRQNKNTKGQYLPSQAHSRQVEVSD